MVHVFINELLHSIEDVKWEGPDIVVFENVKITPPYKPENVQASSSSDSKACNHLRKLVSINLVFV